MRDRTINGYRTSYSSSRISEVHLDPPKSPLERGTLRLSSVPHQRGKRCIAKGDRAEE